ncbi:trypsin-like [Chrysoperla carnea]|uniref:trypsin-like n=1 Tax=Chrysoperla carnea TaxID=189513 RepID=UPI001D084FA1|nr:trypsin-like [Chrysoperla carnea]
MFAHGKFYFSLIVFTILASQNVSGKIRNYGDENDSDYKENRGYAVGNKPYIIKGTDASIEEFPYVVFLTQINPDGQGIESSRYGCTGVILTSTVILTTAICLEHGDDNDFAEERTLQFTNAYIKAGVTNRDDPRAKKIYFARGILHDKYSYDQDYMQYNIALLKLNRPLCRSKTIQPLKFATEDDFEQANKVGTVVGWGWKTANANSLSNTLQQIQMKSVPVDQCDEETGKFVNEHSFCVKDLNDTFQGGICDGDSGTPFIVNNKVYAIGTTIAKGCKSADYFVRVADHEIKSWIKDKCWELHNEMRMKKSPNRPNRFLLEKNGSHSVP